MHICYKPYKANVSFFCIYCHKCLAWIYSVLQYLVKKYSEFINFPIYLWSTKEVDVEVPADDEETSEEEESSKSSINVIFFSLDGSHAVGKC